jgi:capsular exopolysaccharide synthesis family protein
VENVSDALGIWQRGLTNVISIEATSIEPNKAARLTNAVADSYFEVQTEARTSSAKRAAKFLQGRVNELADAIRRDNQRIDEFLRKHGNLIDDSSTDLSQTRIDLDSLIQRQYEGEIQLSKLEQFRADRNPEHLAGAQLSAELQQLVDERNPAFDSANAANSSIIDEQLHQAVTKEIDTLRSTISSNNRRLVEIGKSISASLNRAKIPQSIAVDYYRLQRDAETNRKLYDSYVARLGEVQQQIGLAVSNSRLIASAITPHKPSFPPTGLIISLGIVLGLGLGIGAAILREHAVGGFSSIQQLEAVTGLPVATAVPHSKGQDPHDTIVALPFSSFSESIRRLRIGLENLLSMRSPNVILVTSTRPGEGKTTLAIALARAMAGTGRRTLLVDCDLKHPSVARLLPVKSPSTLPSLLQAPLQVSELPVAHDKRGGIDVLNAEATKYPSDLLLASHEFKALIDNARARYDTVIIDSPPIGFVVDASIMSRLCDAVLYVVRYASTNQRDVVAGLREILGVPDSPRPVMVLNALLGNWSISPYGKNKHAQYYHES